MADDKADKGTGGAPGQPGGQPEWPGTPAPKRTGKPGGDADGPMGDSALTEEAAKDPDVDRSRTPGRSYDV